MTTNNRTLDKLEAGQELEVILVDPDGEETLRDILQIVRLPSPDDAEPGEVRSIYEWKRPVPTGGVPWDIGKEAWKLFRECNRPAPPVSTWVLYKETDPLDYAGAREGSSGTISWVVRDKRTKIVVVDYELKLEGAFGARPNKKKDTPQGQYLPKITMIIKEKKVAFAVCVTGDVHLGPPYNVGGHDNVDPKVQLYITLDLELFWVHHPYRCVFDAQGSEGFSFAGWR